VSLVVAGSADYSFVSSISYPGERNWMRVLRDVIGGRELRHVVMPGSHDSGMSTLQTGVGNGHGWMGGGSVDNTATQGLNIYDQLVYGARFHHIQAAMPCSKIKFSPARVIAVRARVEMCPLCDEQSQSRHKP